MEGGLVESFFCPFVLNPDHAWKHRVDIKFSNSISFREVAKYTLFMAVNCPKKVYYVLVSASPFWQNYFKPFGLTLQYSSAPVQYSMSSSPGPLITDTPYILHIPHSSTPCSLTDAATHRQYLNSQPTSTDS